VQATRRWTRANTNLGIVLLFAPLAKAALSGSNAELRLNLKSVLLTLTYDDARAAYAAIRLAAPGGLDDAVEHDVRDETPAITLREAMAGAAQRDQIAAEYLNDFATIFELGLPALRAGLAKGAPTDQAIIQTYLEILAKVPDTLIARKCGMSTAREVSTEARAALTAGGVFSDKGRRVVGALDSYLRSRNHNQLNPGTTADLIAATLFAALLEGVLK
jgi:triphosphoribosyl-dephospho-CoA synthase